MCPHLGGFLILGEYTEGYTLFLPLAPPWLCSLLSTPSKLQDCFVVTAGQSHRLVPISIPSTSTKPLDSPRSSAGKPTALQVVPLNVQTALIWLSQADLPVVLTPQCFIKVWHMGTQGCSLRHACNPILIAQEQSEQCGIC